MTAIESKRKKLAELVAQYASDSSVETEHQEDDKLEPIAIVGLSGKLPKCSSVKEFWAALDNEVSLLEEVPESRFDIDRYYDASGKDQSKSCTKWGGFIPNLDAFDAGFFNLSAEEARIMDPRQRLLLMSAYHCIEDAGYAPSSLRNSDTAVYVAIEENDHLQRLLEHQAHRHLSIFHATSMVANRLSYYFDLRGPSEVVNTMCSGAAYAIHRAVTAIRAGHVSQALVGAVNLILSPDQLIMLSNAEQLSPTKKIASFARSAAGFLSSEAVAMVFLKPLAKAKTDNDAIYAQIKNSAVNFNGAGGISIASPCVSSHIDLIKSCYKSANVSPDKVTYIEAQGMANPVADLAEWQAFNKALVSLADEAGIELPSGHCTVSTLKPLAGHMHSASSLAALFKIIRAFQTDRIAKIWGIDDISPDLDMHGVPCRLAVENRRWSRGEARRLAGLHSFGSGGCNAHLLIEEYRENADYAFPNDNFLTPTQRDLHILPLSAQSEPQRWEAVLNLFTQLDKTGGDCQPAIEQLAHTLQMGRDAMPWRIAFVAESVSQLIDTMREYLASGIQGPNMYVGSIADSSKPLSERDAHRIAELWVTGGEVDWQCLGTKADKRIHIPGYPFEKRVYKFDEFLCSISNDEASVLYGNNTVPENVAPTDYIVDILSLHVANELGVAREVIDAKKELREYGLDSLKLLRLARKLDELCEQKVRVKEIRDKESIYAIALYIRDNKMVRYFDRVSVERKFETSEVQHEDNESQRFSAYRDNAVIEMLESLQQGEIDVHDIEKQLVV